MNRQRRRSSRACLSLLDVDLAQFVVNHQAKLIDVKREFFFKSEVTVAAEVAVFASAGDDPIFGYELKFWNKDMDDIDVHRLFDLELQAPDPLRAHGRREIELEEGKPLN